MGSLVLNFFFLSFLIVDSCAMCYLFFAIYVSSKTIKITNKQMQRLYASVANKYALTCALYFSIYPSSETQGQLVGATGSLSGQRNFRAKVYNKSALVLNFRPKIPSSR